MPAVGVDAETTDGVATGRKPAIALGVVLGHARAVACERKNGCEVERIQAVDAAMSGRFKVCDVKSAITTVESRLR